VQFLNTSREEASQPARSRSLLPQLEPKPVIIFVRANPKPQNSIAFAQAKYTVMIADSHNTYVVASFFKPKGRMKWIAFPNCVFLSCEILNRGRQFLESLPETPMRLADHGSSSTRPA
jgi:hypothetical protein